MKDDKVDKLELLPLEFIIIYDKKSFITKKLATVKSSPLFFVYIGFYNLIY